MEFKAVSTLSDSKHNAFPTVKSFGNYEFLAFRSANSHFSSKSSIAIYRRKKGEMNWELQDRITLPHTDVRDPELGIINGVLCLVFAVLAGKRSDIYFSSFEEPSFISPKPLFLCKQIPSKFITLNNETFLLTFRQHMLHKDEVNLVEVTQSGSVTSCKPLPPEIHGTETDLIEFNNKIIGVSRIEKSASNKQGSAIFILNKDFTLSHFWYSPIKHDSPELFVLDNELFLMSRSTPWFKGKFNLLRIPFFWWLNSLINHGIYWITPKALSVYKITRNLTVEKVKDLPFYGDTGYTSYSNQHFFTYASYRASKSRPWLWGQLNRTIIVEFSVESE